MNLRIAIALFTLTTLTGCGSSYSIVPVSGVVTFDDKPLADATVVFTPTKGGPSSFGTTKADGRFTLETMQEGDDGALVGKHSVSVTLASDEEFDTSTDITIVDAKRKIPRRYNSATTLVYDVGEETSGANFALTSDKDERDNLSENGDE